MHLFQGIQTVILLALTITVLSIVSLFAMLQFLWQSSTVSPTGSLQYPICANSPILIMSHSVNTALPYAAGTAKSVQ